LLSEPLSLERYLLPLDLARAPAYRFDVVVLGSGIAGASAALAAAAEGASVALLAKAELAESNTHWARGGMAAVLAAPDAVASHVEDTLRVGCGLSEPAVVEAVVRAGPAAVERLLELGVELDRDPSGALALSKEGGHSHARIVHAHGDATGAELQRGLSAALLAERGVAVFPRTFGIDVLTDGAGRAVGVLCQTARGETVAFGAGQVVLATGGAGQLYRETTNPVIATGDGVAMGLRAGAAVRDLEFVQFHPTCLYIAGAARVLISEVVRGHGGILVDRHGVRFMPHYHEDAELAPRDVVSRAVAARMAATADTSVYLDLSHIDGDPHELFPSVSRICRFFGIDIARDPVPVRPGAHYLIGGLSTDLDGQTSVDGLRAVGECASSGLHGANRLGSNSLLEGAVLGARAGAAAARAGREADLRGVPPVPGRALRALPDGVQVSLEDILYSLKSLMWRQVGVERTRDGLEDAVAKIRFWTRAVTALDLRSARELELVNMLSVSRLVALGALAREESRGTHFRTDLPVAREDWRAHVVQRPVFDGGRLARLEIARRPLSGVLAVA
jgi:L-aspartate oxidase